MAKLPNIVTRNLNKKLRRFTNNQTAQQPTRIDLDDVRGVYNIGSPGEPQTLVIHKRDLITLGVEQAVSVTLFFDEFAELQEMVRQCRRFMYNGFAAHSGTENAPREIFYEINVLGYDENGEKSGQLVDAGQTDFGDFNTTAQDRAWTSEWVARPISSNGGKWLETNAGVQEFTDFTPSEVFIKLINPENNSQTIVNFWVYFEFWF